MIVETIQSELYNLIQKHDWSYMMSDSHDVWDAGMKADRLIQAKIHALVGVHKEDAQALYEWSKSVAGSDYTDYDKNGYGLKYRVIHSWFRTYIGEIKAFS